MQQAGLSTILTMLLITAPGMAAAFFQGTLGQFMHYSAFDQNPRNAPSARGPAGSMQALPQSTAAGNGREIPPSAQANAVLPQPRQFQQIPDETKTQRREG